MSKPLDMAPTASTATDTDPCKALAERLAKIEGKVAKLETEVCKCAQAKTATVEPINVEHLLQSFAIRHDSHGGNSSGGGNEDHEAWDAMQSE